MTPAKSDSFTSSPIWIPFISFLLWLLWLGFPELWWIKVVRVDILVLFLILEEMLSAFQCWVWCLLWVCFIWSFLCWVSFPVCPLFEEVFLFVINGRWILSKVFSALIEMINCFFFFSLLIGISYQLIWWYWKILASLGYSPFHYGI